MERSRTIEELLEFYYERFSKKQAWETVIADDFEYKGGSILNQEPTIGKSNYIAVIKRFSGIFQSMRVNEMIIENNRACVIGNYNFKFLNGQEINGDVSEIWTARDGKLASLTIFFDTLTFDKNTPKLKID